MRCTPRPAGRTGDSTLLRITRWAATVPVARLCMTAVVAIVSEFKSYKCTARRSSVVGWFSWICAVQKSVGTSDLGIFGSRGATLLLPPDNNVNPWPSRAIGTGCPCA